MGAVKTFFRNSDLLDGLALRQLSHVNGNWELTWDESSEQYEPDDDSFAAKVNELVDELETLPPPRKYHDNEDRLAEQVQERLGWKVRKVGGRWVGADYPMMLEQGSFTDFNQRELMLAVAGRIHAAMIRGQMHFDEMDDAHRKMLADVLAIVLYHRADA
jgi:hypothetical protein